MSIFFHEQIYRTPEAMTKLKEPIITLCGAGTLGANIAENLTRSGVGSLQVIDCDRIEERNLSTQPYYRSDIGAFKAKILANQLYRAIGAKVVPETKRLTSENAAQLLKGSALVIDAFDNSVARQAVKDCCKAANLPCLHVGLAGDYAEIVWNEEYRVPSAINDDVCDYPLARNLVLLAVAIASETIVNFITTGEKSSFTITLKDMSIQPMS